MARSKPKRTPLFPWKPIFANPETIAKEYADGGLDGFIDTLTIEVSHALSEAGLPTRAECYADAEVLREVDRRCKNWHNESTRTWSSPPLWEAAQAMRYADGARRHIRNGDIMGAVWCVHQATVYSQRFSTMRLEPAFMHGAASRAGAIHGGKMRRDDSKRARLEADLAQVKKEHPGKLDAHYAELICTRRRKAGIATDAKTTVKVQISRLRNKS
jgi:hypothetical protein